MPPTRMAERLSSRTARPTAQSADGAAGRHVRRARRAASCSIGSASRRATRSSSARRRSSSAASIRSEPDLLSSGIGFGPRLIVPIEALRATGLVRPGSLITWTYRIRLPEGANDDRGRRTGCAARPTGDFPEAGWSIRSRDNAAPSLSRNIERFSQFLTLVGLTALVVGGVGVANAVSSFVDLKRPAIATLKCLGAPNGVVFRIYLIQILILAGVRDRHRPGWSARSCPSSPRQRSPISFRSRRSASIRSSSASPSSTGFWSRSASRLGRLGGRGSCRPRASSPTARSIRRCKPPLPLSRWRRRRRCSRSRRSPCASPAIASFRSSTSAR